MAVPPWALVAESSRPHFRRLRELQARAEAVLPESCFGMPAVSRADRKVAAGERIPPALFYLPLVFNWVRLGLRHRSMTLPTAANPNIFTGGMWGESKSSYFFDVTPAELISGIVTDRGIVTAPFDAGIRELFG